MTNFGLFFYGTMDKTLITIRLMQERDYQESSKCGTFICEAAKAVIRGAGVTVGSNRFCNQGSDCGVPLAAQCCELSLFDSSADSAHQRLQKVQIVNGCQAYRRRFLGHK